MRMYFQAKVLGARKSFSRSEREAKLGFRFLAIAYLLLLLYCVPGWLDFAHFPFANWFRWTGGIALLAAYLLLFAWTHRSLGKHWSGLLEIHEDHALVTSGPYQYVRHPMYTAFMLSGLGFLFLSANWLIAGIYVVAVVAMIAPRIAAEEAMMVERFGELYQQYIARTGRFLPRFRVP